jgi:hypothetical protein
MWGYDKQLALIADVRGGLVGADAIANDDDELARVVAQIAAEGDGLHTGDAELSGRDAWVASLSGLKDESDKVELERARLREEEYLKRRQWRANRPKLWYVPPPDHIEPQQGGVGSEGGL